MGFLANQLSVHDPSPTADFWYGPAGRQVTSGVDVTHETAFNYSAVWAATRLLSGTISTLPRVLFREQDGRKEKATGHPTYAMFRDTPNPEYGGVTFWEQVVNFSHNWGNMYAEIQRDGLGRVVRLWTIHPSRIPDRNIRRDDNGELVYHVRNDGDLGTTPIKRADMLHVPGALSENGITGKSVIRVAAESIGMGLATEQHGAAFFGNGASPSMVMTHPKHLTPEAADNLRRSWSSTYDGPAKSGGVLVLEEGTTVTPITIPPEQAQFLETRQFNISEIARWYNVPPHLLRELSKSSFNNIESESLHFVKISIVPLVGRYEEECNRQLLTDGDRADGYFFKFMLRGLLRGDSESQTNAYQKMRDLGVYTVNDILGFEDMNPIGPEGDVRLVPTNMWTIEAAERAGAEPAATSDVSPIGETDETETEASVQEKAMNGGQIVALINMAARLAAEGLPPDGTEAMMKAAYPDMDESLITQMVTDFAAHAEEHKDDEPEVPPVIPPVKEDEPDKPEEPLSIKELDTERDRDLVDTEVRDIGVKLREQKSLLRSLEAATACINKGTA